jgi:chemotaxis protein MotB
MFKKLSVIALCLSLILLSACVSKKEYLALETKSNQTQAQLELDKENLQAQISKLNSENNRLLDTVEGLKAELNQEKLAELNQEKLAVQQKEREVSELDKTRMEIESSLKEQIAQKDIKLEEIEGKLKVTFVDKILFDSGSVMIKSKGQEVLLKLADSFRDAKDQNIAVEGHTDDVQIGSALIDRFPTNWELSTARATAIVRFLQEKGNIAPERLTASGFSFYRAVATNETPEGREQNRRIEIILVPVR